MEEVGWVGQKIVNFSWTSYMYDPLILNWEILKSQAFL